MYGKIKRIHFVGIGGIGMSGIAEVLLNLGYEVSGSDLRASELTRRLESLGGRVNYGHAAENVQEAQVVVTSTAVSSDNPEVVEAHRLLVPVIPRAEMLAELMRLKYGIAVAGTHGKTTTTSMVATLLSHGGIDPTAVVGGRLNALGSNAKLGQGEFMVVEADESDGSFLKLTPTIAVVTNIDEDHLDYYSGMDEIRGVFLDFINKIPFYGLAVLCLDDANIQTLLPQVQKRYVTYGLTPQADFSATEIEHRAGGTEFTVHFRQEKLGRIRLEMPGRHNVLNALASLAVARELDVPMKTICEGFESFAGVQRRFQIKLDDEVMVVDDYGHHPAEIKATLSAARNGWDRRVVVIFQPHRYSRTQALFDDFVTAFYQADVLLVMDVYAASEAPIEGVCGEDLAKAIAGHGHRQVTYCNSEEAVVKQVLDVLKPDDIVITLGAGSVWKVGETLIEHLTRV
ncbi:UDP-N-acetylmuramate--L-alanine ligase [Desulfuromonas acetoxidans]|uniref:UDP-N-acetylmuramate--L-alanine ligase n=1 Tax=Desulfuromonas acetoxidans (strain DSM 684 / 11070) TaxID=281689 RepID=Q1JXB6_DESA6|nr:UDP-N-acetylmuramate--L-alanine ligase [Desulfuromonas acetoxidans]EAT14876.1 UDP-N-acetylmuramate--alanine ligase [Desulfuromonas acetoxidans DSM 684]MBF0646844.1 UDP-N-acetylmuramate--L-alanine ligase [Desulfuromonas acetoxidans]NVD23336.1 UDP-N-acetylmuramate--L-alanine ligase [Desulfuromonas acetoxidans]NVE15423.1 UDP-N-acetylmuramate--L-alanine ligase [Desulfuromonas acetoxidans]